MAEKSVSTDRQVAALKPAAVRYFRTVAGCPGLRIAVSRSGQRTFFYRTRLEDGRLQQQKIGQYHPQEFGLREARARWRELRDIRETHGVVREKIKSDRAKRRAELLAAAATTERDAYTVRVLAQEFIDHQSATIKTWRKTRSNLDVYVLPHIGERPAHSIRRADVLAILDTLARAGLIVTSNRVLAAVRAMFNWAIQREKPGIEANPCTAIKPQKEHGRERALSDVELRRLYTNMPDSTLTADERDLIEFILLTGCRLTEACAAPLDEFDGDLWILPPLRTKNNRQHRLPLSKQAAALVKRRSGNSPWLFSMASNPKQPMRADAIHTPLREALPALKVLPFRPHDLRRSTASGIAALGAPRDTVRRILNHTDRSVTAIYDRADYTPELRRWLQAWADHLDALRGVKVAKRRARA